MKAYVCTYCTWESYGSLLQSLALKRTLQELGLDSEILVKGPAPVFTDKPLFGHGLSRTAVRIHDRLIRAERERSFERGNAFIGENLDLVYGPETEAVLRGEKTAELYLAGSDQIWNPDLCDPVFFLQFAPEGKKCVSYAASMGKTEIAPEKRERIRAYLERFDSISVREQACRDVLTELTEREISVHVDPTLLRPGEEWRALEAEYPVTGPYILLYAIYWDPALNDEVRRLRQRTGLPVYVIAGHLNKCYADKRIFDAGPREFLWLIDHAEMVITSSFHALVMSILFRKRVSAVLNPRSPSRLENLCSLLDVAIRPIGQLDREEPVYEEEGILRTLRNERDAATDYLKKAIFGT